MGTDVVGAVSALESHIAGLMAELTAAKREGLMLAWEIDSMSEGDFLHAWDAMENEYAPLFGVRGIYPEIPRHWMPVIIRLASRLRAILSEREYQAVEVTSAKEKFGLLSIGYYVDMDFAGPDGDLYHRVSVLVDEAEQEASRMDAIRNRLG